MKRALMIIVALLLYAGVYSQSTKEEIPDYCESSSDYKKAAKNQLKPKYSYDASKTTKITYKNKPQLKELEIPLYLGEEYRFVFNTEGLPQSIDINIYNKKLEAKNRKLIWSSRNQTSDEDHILIFEPEKSRKMYINYVIPPTTDEIKKGCIVFVLGYKIKGIEKD